MVEGVNPCPCCGYSKPQVYHRCGNRTRRYNKDKGKWECSSMYYVKCNKCNTTGPMIVGEREKAIKMWNGLKEMYGSSLYED